MINPPRKKSSEGPPPAASARSGGITEPLLPSHAPQAQSAAVERGLLRAASLTKNTVQRPRSTGKGPRGAPVIDVKRAAAIASAAFNGPSASALRQRDKFVPLGPEAEEAAADARNRSSVGAADRRESPSASGVGVRAARASVSDGTGSTPAIFEDLDEGRPCRGRITVMTLAEGFDRKKIESLLRGAFPKLETHTYQDVVHATPDREDPACPDVFFFDYGTAVFWGISAADEQALVMTVVNPAKQEPLDLHEVEIDEFTYNYSTVEPPHISNDVITINKSYAADHQVKLAISHALAQSTLLGSYEERLQDIVEVTRELPEALAAHGRVSISRKQIARLIGQVFLQRSAVNLLGSVLDVPDYFWSAPDHLQVLYKRVCQYLELDTRVEVINTRYAVLQELLEVVRDHTNNILMSQLEWVVIWLIVAAVVLGCLQVAGLLGFIQGSKHR